MKKNLTSRLLSLVLVLSLVCGLAVPAMAAPGETASTVESLSFEKVDTSVSVGDNTADEVAVEPDYAPEDVVRVSIVLERPATLMAGFPSDRAAKSAAAISYREALRAHQDVVAAEIEKATGAALNVVRHLTLAVNLMSAYVQFGQIETIEKVAGVKLVAIENCYEPMATESGDEINMSTSTNVVGARTVWANGYTGAGSKVAVIDTGLDTDHQSFAESGYNYSMGLNAEAKGMTLEEYKASVGVLTKADIEAVLTQLNAYESSGKTLTADKAYLSDKVPYAYNYIDENFVVDHDHDSQGEHGSHVEGTAAANRYIPQNGSFVDALTAVRVAGNAPDAQIITMKVFGAAGGAYESDYMAAIEDAIILGADSANLSLGSSNPGFAFDPSYQELLEALPKSSTVVSISAGNAYAWNSTSNTGVANLYIEDVSMDTVGSPGSYHNSLSVAALNTTSSTYSFASFSSWGVPGSLTMKPEISAPGYQIYSVNGARAGGTSYENMSGTSMAAPQITGMTGLFGQYFRANGLAEKTGLNQRTLANSLLMSTAVPVNEGANYFPVLRQGAGLGRIDLATMAKSYILMDEGANTGAADGKVKVELGDDPARTGEYEWSFTLNNLTDEELSYTMRSDLFTQALKTQNDLVYMNTTTTALAHVPTFIVDGVEVASSSPIAADVNKDGTTDAADAQAILNYVVGLVEDVEALDLAAADVNKDEAVTSYDAHLILAGIRSNVFTLPANGKVNVTVKVALTDEEKANLNENYPNGAYIEGYNFIESVKDADGNSTDSTHSIPVLGFYGNWTDPSMFDAVSVTDTHTGNSKLPYTGFSETNGLVFHLGESLRDQWFMGNPFTAETPFPAEKLALRSDATLYQFRYNLIRNAASLFAAVSDEDGNVVYVSDPSYNANSAYYYVNGRAWQSTTPRNFILNKSVAELGFGVGDTLTVGYYAVPEYYANETNYARLTAADAAALVESDVLGSGASISYTITLDDEAPVLNSVVLDVQTGNLVVNTQDDNYVAAVMLMNADGTKTYGAVVPESERGEAADSELAYSGNPGSTALLVVGDYAGNRSVYVVKLAPEQVDLSGKMIGFTANTTLGAGWKLLDPAAVAYTSASNHPGIENYMSSPVTVRAAEYVDGYVFMAGTDNALYAAPLTDLDLVQKVGTLTASITDLAFNYADGKLYAIGGYASSTNHIYTVDLKTGALTEQYTVTITNPRSTSANYKRLMSLAIDDAGNFYSTSNGNSGSSTNYSFLYKWTAANVQMPEYDEETGELVPGSVDAPAIVNLAPVVNTSSGNLGVTQHTGAGALAWDHNNGVLYMVNASANNMTGSSNNNKLVVVNTTTGKAAAPNSLTNGGRTYGAFTGLFVVPAEKPLVPPTEIAEGIELSNASLSLLENRGAVLTASVYPWTLSDKSVTWSSSNEAVAVVTDDGEVRAVAVGTAVITATTSAEPHLTATCEVNVTAARFSMMGLLQDEAGTPEFYTWDLQHELTWTPGVEIASDILASVYNPTNNTVIFANSASEVWSVDMEGTAALIGKSPVSVLDDLALTSHFTDANGEPLLFAVSGTSFYGGLGYSQGITGDADHAWTFRTELSNAGASTFVAMTWAGCTYDEATETYTEYFKALANNGVIFTISFNGSVCGIVSSAPSNVNVKWDNSYGGYFTSMVMADDNEHMLLSAFDGNVNYVMLISYSETANAYSATTLGDFGDGVWPCTISRATANVAPTTAAGSLNAVSGDAVLTVGGAYDENTATVSVTEDVDTASGKFTVTYDPEVLTLTGFNGVGLYAMVNGEGTLTFAFASETAVAAGESIADLIFTYKADYVNTTVTVTTVECNAEFNVADDSAEITVVHEEGEHNYVVTDSKAATCTEAGYVTYTCTKCGDTYTEVVEAIGHNYETVSVPATCEEDGSVTSTCANCGETCVEVIPAIGHDYKVVRVAEATCTEDGYTGDVVCANCDKVLHVGTTVAAFGHSWSEWETTVVPTCTTEGEQTRTCETCGSVETEVLPVDPENCASAPFTDVKQTAWFHEAVDFVVMNGLMKGDSATTFSPNAELSRAMVVSILYRMAGEPSVEGLENKFTDVKNTAWYANAVIWASENGIAMGVTATTFAPNASVTRQQMATFLFRFSGAEPVEEDHLSAFADAGTIQAAYKPALNWAAANGLLSGQNVNGKLCVDGKGTATRAQFASILMRFCQL